MDRVGGVLTSAAVGDHRLLLFAHFGDSEDIRCCATSRRVSVAVLSGLGLAGAGTYRLGCMEDRLVGQ